ncbi:MAG: hypothetical protein ACOVRN_01545 [Flavobacterium sp.]
MKKVVCKLLVALAIIGCKKSEDNENASVAYEAKSVKRGQL